MPERRLRKVLGVPTQQRAAVENLPRDDLPRQRKPPLALGGNRELGDAQQRVLLGEAVDRPIVPILRG
jgi:hypothetical protein